MLDILTKVIGLIACFYMIKGMLGKARHGDLTKFLLALAALLVVIVFKNGLV